MKWMLAPIILLILAIAYFVLNGQNEITCDKPFIRYGTQCCLDQDNNGACDSAMVQQVQTNISTWQDAINSVDNLETKYSLSCNGGIKNNVLYVVHIIQSEKYIECEKLKERIDVIKSKPGIFDNYLKIIDDCNSNTVEALTRTLKGFAYGRLLPLRDVIPNSNDFYYIYSGCVHEPDQSGGVFSFFQMAIDKESGVTAGMSSR